MYQIDNSSAAATQPASTTPGPPGFFTDGSVTGGIPATIVPAEWLNAVQEELINVLAAAGITPTKNQFSQLATAIKGILQGGTSNYGVDIGTANNYAVTYTPAVTAITDGLKLRFKAKNANTGASTFAPNGLTAGTLVGGGHAALQGGEIIANGDIEVVWNSTLNAWVMLEQTGGAVQVANAENSQQAMALGQATGRLLRTTVYTLIGGVQQVSVNGAAITSVGASTFTSLAQTNSVYVTGVGGGGAGGGSPACTSTQAAGGAGGAAGSPFEMLLTSGFSGGVAITIGAGGVGALGVAGTSGGTTSFGALASAPGGGFATAGSATSAFPQINGYGAPGAQATGGNIFNGVGGFGSPAFAVNDGSVISGSGGASILGGGANARISATGGGSSSTSPGGGGGGAVTLASGAAQTGGNGSPGMIIVYEYT